jgi:hypothetical protein
LPFHILPTRRFKAPESNNRRYTNRRITFTHLSTSANRALAPHSDADATREHETLSALRLQRLFRGYKARYYVWELK